MCYLNAHVHASVAKLVRASPEKRMVVGSNLNLQPKAANFS